MTASAPAVRFAVIGLEHPHVYSMAAELLRAGAELVAVADASNDAVATFGRLFSSARPALEAQILDDETIDLVVLAGVPAERAPLGVRAMQHGKDVLSDKPAAITASALAELRDAQAATRRMFSVYFSERLESRATMRAADLVRAGDIGTVVQIVGFGPHRLDLASRPAWFLDPARAGGILCDLACHQIDQFLHFADAPTAEIVSSVVANHAHPDEPGLQDYGEIHLRTHRASGFARVDWYTPAGLSTWGDGRLFVLGTDGYIEVRKNCDVAGRPGGDHLIVVDGRATHRVDCQQDDLRFARELLGDVRDRTERAMSQAHCFSVCELAIEAQDRAERAGHLGGTTP